MRNLEITVPSDKSISHRLAIFSLLCDENCKIENYLKSLDTLSTLEVLRTLGCEIKITKEDLQSLNLEIYHSELKPHKTLYCGNSGTTARLFLGLLAGLNLPSTITGDTSLSTRPFARVCGMLEHFGAQFSSGYAALPLEILPNDGLSATNFDNAISSAQMKSAFILSALFASNPSHYTEIMPSRDHSENILNHLCSLNNLPNVIKIHISSTTSPASYDISPLPRAFRGFDARAYGDPSSGFYFAILALLLHTSIELKDLYISESRIGAYRVLQDMGALVDIEQKASSFGEKIGNIKISYKAPLKSINIDSKKYNLSTFIDEIPALSIAMAFASEIDAKYRIEGARELRLKESDRIRALGHNFELLGVEFCEFEDGFSLKSTKIKDHSNICLKSFNDHRIAMSFSLLAAICAVNIDDCKCIDISFPNFLQTIKNLIGGEN